MKRLVLLPGIKFSAPSYPCWDCGGTMHPMDCETPIGRRYQCERCGLSAPRRTCERHILTNPLTHKRKQGKAVPA